MSILTALALNLGARFNVYGIPDQCATLLVKNFIGFVFRGSLEIDQTTINHHVLHWID